MVTWPEGRTLVTPSSVEVELQAATQSPTTRNRQPASDGRPRIHAPPIPWCLPPTPYQEHHREPTTFRRRTVSWGVPIDNRSPLHHAFRKAFISGLRRGADAGEGPQRRPATATANVVVRSINDARLSQLPLLGLSQGQAQLPGGVHDLVPPFHPALVGLLRRRAGPVAPPRGAWGRVAVRGGALVGRSFAPGGAHSGVSGPGTVARRSLRPPAWWPACCPTGRRSTARATGPGGRAHRSPGGRWARLRTGLGPKSGGRSRYSGRRSRGRAAGREGRRSAGRRSHRRAVGRGHDLA